MESLLAYADQIASVVASVIALVGLALAVRWQRAASITTSELRSLMERVTRVVDSEANSSRQREPDTVNTFNPRRAPEERTALRWKKPIGMASSFVQKRVAEEVDVIALLSNLDTLRHQTAISVLNNCR